MQRTLLHGQKTMVLFGDARKVIEDMGKAID